MSTTIFAAFWVCLDQFYILAQVSDQNVCLYSQVKDDARRALYKEATEKYVGSGAPLKGRVQVWTLTQFFSVSFL